MVDRTMKPWYTISMKEKFKVYWMADRDLPEVMFTGTWDECKAFIAADSKKNGRNILSRFYAIAK